jgi:serine/threonine protein kinase
MAQFDHPHIAYLVGITTKGLPYMLHMAYYEHGLAVACFFPLFSFSAPTLRFTGNLLDFLKSHTGFLELALSPKLIILHDIADGMSYLEARSFVHRDLAARFVCLFVCLFIYLFENTPTHSLFLPVSNVLLSSDFNCKITDFGLSRELGGKEVYVSEGRGQIALRWTAPEALTKHEFTSASVCFELCQS